MSRASNCKRIRISCISYDAENVMIKDAVQSRAPKYFCFYRRGSK